MKEWETPDLERFASAQLDANESIKTHGLEKATALLLRDAKKALYGPYPRYTPLILEIEALLAHWKLE